MDNIERYGLLRISSDNELERMELKLIKYTMDDIGTIYEYLTDDDSYKAIRILIEMPIRFPTL